MGRAAEDVAPSSSMRTDGGYPVAQVNDLSRSLTAFDPVSTLVVVVEMSKARWLVSGAVCGKAACTALCGGRSVMSVPTASAQIAAMHESESGPTRTLGDVRCRAAIGDTADIEDAPPRGSLDGAIAAARPHCGIEHIQSRILMLLCMLAGWSREQTHGRGLK